MMNVIDQLLQALDGHRALRLEQVRASMAGRILRRNIMPQVCRLLERMHGLRYEESDADWSRMFVLLHDLRDVFVHVRVPAMVIHRAFGRMCAAVCDAMVIEEPERWSAIPRDLRTQALCCIRNAVGRALAEADWGFMGTWAEGRAGELARAMQV